MSDFQVAWLTLLVWKDVGYVTAGQSVGTTFRITPVLINSVKSIIKSFPFPGAQTHVSRQVLSSCQHFLVWVLCFLSMQLSIGLPVRLNNIILC